MGREIEVKLRLERPGDFRRRLESLGARLQSHVFERNTILDTRQARLQRQGAALRVRVEHALGSPAKARTLLTYKGARDAAGSSIGVKSRVEVEVRVDDEAPLAAILQHIGFRAVLTFEKRRRTWRLGECLVTLDELPGERWFAEIEGPSAQAVEAALAKLELAAGSVVAETYVEMAARFGRRDAGGVCRWHFEEPSGQDTR